MSIVTLALFIYFFYTLTTTALILRQEASCSGDDSQSFVVYMSGTTVSMKCPADEECKNGECVKISPPLKLEHKQAQSMENHTFVLDAVDPLDVERCNTTGTRYCVDGSNLGVCIISGKGVVLRCKDGCNSTLPLGLQLCNGWLTRLA